MGFTFLALSDINIWNMHSKGLNGVKCQDILTE